MTDGTTTVYIHKTIWLYRLTYVNSQKCILALWNVK